MGVRLVSLALDWAGGRRHRGIAGTSGGIGRSRADRAPHCEVAIDLLAHGMLVGRREPFVIATLEPGECGERRVVAARFAGARRDSRGSTLALFVEQPGVGGCPLAPCYVLLGILGPGPWESLRVGLPRWRRT